MMGTARIYFIGGQTIELADTDLTDLQLAEWRRKIASSIDPLTIETPTGVLITRWDSVIGLLYKPTPSSPSP